MNDYLSVIKTFILRMIVLKNGRIKILKNVEKYIILDLVFIIFGHLLKSA